MVFVVESVKMFAEKGFQAALHHFLLFLTMLSKAFRTVIEETL